MKTMKRLAEVLLTRGAALLRTEASGHPAVRKAPQLKLPCQRPWALSDPAEAGARAKPLSRSNGISG